MSKQLKGSLLLLLTAIIWGAAFVAQSEGMKYVGPFTMQATRFFLAGIVILPVVLLCDRKRLTPFRPTDRQSWKKALLSCLICGSFIFIASSFQQFGLLYTTVGKSGFITALYILLVPLIGILLGKRVTPLVWAGVGLAVVGLYFLCMNGSLSFNPGDLMTLAGAFFFALQILYIDRAMAFTDGVRLACGQCLVCSFFSAVCMFIFEKPTWSAIVQCWLPIFYAGVMSGGIAYTLQILGQRDTDPTVASLLMSFESFFAALFGWLLLGQALSARELFGCALMLAAIILAQLPDRRKKIAQ